MNEKELVIKAKKGDIDSFCILYDKYKRKLYNYAYYRLGNSEDAEDTVQNCVLTAYEQLKNLKKPESFSSWIFKILYYGCIDSVQGQIKQRNTVDIEDYKNTLFYDASYIEREELKQALNILNDDEKNIVLLSVIVGLSSKEVAKITGFTAGNVRQKLSRSLAKMKRFLS